MRGFTGSLAVCVVLVSPGLDFFCSLATPAVKVLSAGVLSELGSDGLLSGEDVFFIFSRVANPESVDRALSSAPGEGKLDVRGDTPGGEDEGERGGSGDCLSLDRSKRSSDSTSAVDEELSGWECCDSVCCTCATSLLGVSSMSIIRSAPNCS